MTTKSDQPLSKRPRRLWHRLRLSALVVAGLFVLAVVLLQLLIGPQIRRKLRATVAAHLDASLSVESLVYRPPFTVRLFGVHFVAHPKQPGGGTELLAAKEIDLSLAELPLHPGPLIIEKLAIDELTLHVIRGADGNYLGTDLARPSAESPSSAAMKLSDVLRLRHFALKGGSIIYQDQATSNSAKSIAVEWRGIDSEVALQPKSPSLYGFHADASDEPIAGASVDGLLDVDSLLLQIKRFAATVQTPPQQKPGGAIPSKPDPLPPRIRAMVQRYAVQGTVTLVTSGEIPLKDPSRASLIADLGVKGARATVPVTGETLDDLALSVHVQRDPSPSGTEPVKLQLRHFRAVSAGAILQLSSGVAMIKPDGSWSAGDISGALDAPLENHGPWGLTGHADFHADVSHDPHANQTPCVGDINIIGINLRPPDLAAAVEQLTGSIHLAGSNINDARADVRSFTALYGGDHLALDHAAIASPQYPDRIIISDIQSHLDLVQDAPQCPGDLGPILQTFQPSGPFTITGTAAMRHVMRDDGPGYSPEWELNIATENGNLALLDERLAVTGLKGTMLATKHAISIPGLQGNLLGGSMDLVGTARVVEPIVYAGNFTVHGANVTQFSRAFDLKAPDGTAPSGSANLRFKFFSQKAAPSTESATTQPESDADEWLGLLGGDGSLQIDNGDLWALPALRGLSRRTRVAREALTAGEAAAIFSVANRTIYFKHVAVYSPALGLQGSGIETFAGRLNLDIIAAPLGDWRQKLAETNIPIFGHLLSSAAGSIEKFVGNATSELLYHFRITGSRDNPIVQTIPAPFITDSAANLFARMLRHDGSTKLVDAVNEK